MDAAKTKAIDTVSKAGEQALLEVCYTWAGISKRRILETQGNMIEEERIVLIQEMKEYMKGYLLNDIFFFFSSIANVLGPEFLNLDLEARLDRLYISLCSQLPEPDINAARETWKRIIAHKIRSKSAKLWLKYYQWELQWGTKRAAGAILRHACSKAATIDDPKAIFDAYIEFVNEWGDTADAEEANWKLRRWREKVPPEALTAAVQQPLQEALAETAQSQIVSEVPIVTISPAEERTPNKRRRSMGIEDLGSPRKKSRPSIENLNQVNDEHAAFESAPHGEGSALKRDREHTMVIVRNLPLEIKELRLRQFFRDVSCPV